MGDLIKTSATALVRPSVQISCPTGKKVTGGGGRCVSLGAPGMGWTFLWESYPLNDVEWKVSCDTPNVQNVRLDAYILCN